jgi:hypothetical protein
MNLRAKLYLAISLVALPGLAAAHNGRDATYAAKPAVSASGSAAAKGLQPGDYIVDIYVGIKVCVDPKTGARTYTQVGDIPSNPARAHSTMAMNAEAGVGYWVDKSFQKNGSGGYVAPPEAPAVQMSSYGDQGSYSDYGYAYGYGGGYYGGYYGGGGGGGHGRPGGGDGRPGRPGDGNGSDSLPHGGGYRLQPGSKYSPPPGPYGGGVGSPPPYDDRGVGAPAPTLRYGGFRTRRG